VVWGSETLARLEAIKKEIDPSYILDCQKCVGNNRVSEGSTEVTQAKEEEDEKESIATNNHTTTSTTSSGGFGISYSSFDVMSFFFAAVSMSLNYLFA